MGSGAFLNEAINQLADAYLSAKQKETGERLDHDRLGEERQKVKAYIAAHNVYGVDLNPVARELAEVSLWLNSIYKGCPVPWFNMQLVAGNSLIGARRQAFSSHLLQPQKGGASWRDQIPVRYPLYKGSGKREAGSGEWPVASGKSDVGKSTPTPHTPPPNGPLNPTSAPPNPHTSSSSTPTPHSPPPTRPKHSVYHFLLPDTNMSNYQDKVVKKMVPDELKAIRDWRRAFCKDFEEHQVDILERVSLAIDKLWDAHAEDRRELRRRTRDVWDIYGQPTPDSPPPTRPLSTQEKDRLFTERILSRIDANSSAYRRLKLVMDYWCALWFWPIEQAHMLPSREEYLLELRSIVEGGVLDVVIVEEDQYLMNLGDAPVQQELDTAEERGYVNLQRLCQNYPRLKLVSEIADRHRFMHWELEFADLFADRGGFDLVLGNPPWVKVEWSEAGILGDVNPRFVFDKLSSSRLNAAREQAMEQFASLRDEYLAEFEEADGSQVFLNAEINYPALRGIQTNLYKCFLPQAWMINHEDGVSGFLHPDGTYDDPKGGKLRSDIYPRLRYHLQFQNEHKLFSDVHNETIFSVNVYRSKPSQDLKFLSMANLFIVDTLDRSFAHSGQGAVGGIKDDDNNWNHEAHRDRILQVDERTLRLFAKLYDDPGTPADHARLPFASCCPSRHSSVASTACSPSSLLSCSA